MLKVSVMDLSNIKITLSIHIKRIDKRIEVVVVVDVLILEYVPSQTAYAGFTSQS